MQDEVSSLSNLGGRPKGLSTGFGSAMNAFAVSAPTHKIIDVAIILSTFLVAYYLRMGSLPALVTSGAVLAYFISSSIAGLVFWRVSGLDRRALAFASWRDLGSICALALIGPLAGILVGFLVDRLDAVPRSLPLYHGALLLFGLSGFRFLILLMASRGLALSGQEVRTRTDVLLLGHTALADVYAGAVEAHNAHHLAIAGIVTDEAIAAGTSINSVVVLGKSADLQAVVRRLGVHGIHISRLVLLVPQSDFDTDTEAFLKSQNIEISNFYQTLIPSQPSA